MLQGICQVGATARAHREGARKIRKLSDLAVLAYVTDRPQDGQVPVPEVELQGRHQRVRHLVQVVRESFLAVHRVGAVNPGEGLLHLQNVQAQGAGRRAGAAALEALHAVPREDRREQRHRDEHKRSDAEGETRRRRHGRPTRHARTPAEAHEATAVMLIFFRGAQLYFIF